MGKDANHSYIAATLFEAYRTIKCASLVANHMPVVHEALQISKIQINEFCCTIVTPYNRLL